ncbi:hypothetical protein GGF46_000945 [Coemansia sp. RSA 552]|nr:hypothetical protein GGF46_000945 [Coemansia sp. RSA 552]
MAGTEDDARSHSQAKSADRSSSSSPDEATAAAPRSQGSKLVDRQRSHIDYLMRNIDKPVDLPEPKKVMAKAPPEIVLNVRGSSAGAGSSDFSTYRDLRRKENQRIKLMEEEAAEDKARTQFSEEIESLKRKDEARTARNRAKRQKRKGRGKTTEPKPSK